MGTGPELTTIVATFEYSVYWNKENAYCVSKFRECDTKRCITATGTNLPTTKDVPVVLTGTWETWEKAGKKQFRVSHFELQRANDANGIVAYLQALKVGVGRYKAKAVYDHFQSDTWNVLDNTPERLREVKGFGDKLVQKIITAMKEQGQMKSVLKLFSDAGVEITPAKATNYIKYFKTDAISHIKKNPYLILNVDPGGFTAADRIASYLGLDTNSPQRIMAGAFVVFTREARSGNVCVEKDRYMNELLRFLGCDRAIAEAVVNKLCATNRIRKFENMLYSRTKYEEELQIALNLRRLMTTKSKQYDIEPYIAEYEAENFTLADSQREAVRNLFRYQVSIITGGPGTGKTTVIKACLHAFEKALGDNAYPVLLAPTGRAARRMSEATGHPAATIHSVVGIAETEDGFFDDSPLPGTLFIVDEASMMDQYVANVMLNRIPVNAKVVFVGDPNQLPSVGCGNVLNDMIQSEAIPTTRLSVIYRQAHENPIVKNAYAINNGDTDLLYTDDFCFIETETVRETFKTALGTYIRAVKEYGMDNVVLLNPYRNKSQLTVVLFNQQLQKYLNPVKEGEYVMKAHGIDFRKGDRVMQTRNTEGPKNGDIGYIKSIDRRYDKDNPREWEYTAKIVFNGDDGIETEYTVEQMADVDLAYCSTVHKSQGEEYREVIMVVSEEHPAMMQRNLIYTGITRAKQKVVLIGQRSALNKAIANDRAVKRVTMLADRLSSAN